jgi:hypothetical protein
MILSRRVTEIAELAEDNMRALQNERTITYL